MVSFKVVCPAPITVTASSTELALCSSGIRSGVQIAWRLVHHQPIRAGDELQWAEHSGAPLGVVKQLLSSSFDIYFLWWSAITLIFSLVLWFSVSVFKYFFHVLVWCTTIGLCSFFGELKIVFEHWKKLQKLYIDKSIPFSWKRQMQVWWGLI